MQRISPSFITFVSMKSDKRVLLGMSGGTDSSVAAMRLQEAGYEVTGVTFRFYEAGDETGYLEDARALALKLGMKHITYDARELSVRVLSAICGRVSKGAYSRSLHGLQ